jgi:hypothetical protein
MLEQALTSLAQAERFDHTHSIRWTWEEKAGLVCLLLGNNEQAADWLRRAAALRDSDPQIQALLLVAYKRLRDVSATQHQIQILDAMTMKASKKDIVDSFVSTYQFSASTLRTKISAVATEMNW